jgi:hypothetical protein
MTPIGRPGDDSHAAHSGSITTAARAHQLPVIAESRRFGAVMAGHSHKVPERAAVCLQRARHNG